MVNWVSERWLSSWKWRAVISLALLVFFTFLTGAILLTIYLWPWVGHALLVSLLVVALWLLCYVIADTFFGDFYDVHGVHVLWRNRKR